MANLQGHFDFNVGADMTAPKGKAHWPSYLTVHMSRLEALRVIEHLAHQLAAAPSDEEIVEFFVGTLEESEEDSTTT